MSGDDITLARSLPAADRLQPSGFSYRRALFVLTTGSAPSSRQAAMHLFMIRAQTHTENPHMLHYAVVFFIIAIIAAVFGFGGIAAGAAGIAKILFVIFLVLAVASLLFGRRP